MGFIFNIPFSFFSNFKGGIMEPEEFLEMLVPKEHPTERETIKKQIIFFILAFARGCCASEIISHDSH